VSRSPRGLVEQTGEFHLIFADHRGYGVPSLPHVIRLFSSSPTCQLIHQAGTPWTGPEAVKDGLSTLYFA